MSASGGSQERQPHRIGGSGRADPDGDSGLDSATSGEPVNVARGKLADQLRAAGRTDAGLEAAFRNVPRHAFLPEMEPVHAYQDRAVVILSDGEGLPVSASTQQVADLDLWLTLTEPGLTMDAGLRAISATLAMRAANPREDVTP